MGRTRKSSTESGLQPSEPPPSLGERLRARRAERGLTLEDLAAAAGCTKGYLSLIEAGRRDPAGGLIDRLEAALALAPGTLQTLAAWKQTPAPVRRQVEELESSRREAVSQLRALLKRPPPPPAEGARAPSRVLDDAWRTGQLQSLVDRLDRAGKTGGDERTGAGAPGGGSRASLAGVLRGVAGNIPVMNRVAAGSPREFEGSGSWGADGAVVMRIPGVTDPEAFACPVIGDSMSPEYRDGDLVVFSPARAVASGMDCYVRLEPDHEATFKRVFFEDAEGNAVMPTAGAEPGAPPVSAHTHIRLQPLNPNYPARRVAREQVAGLAAAVCITRRVP